MLNEIKQFLEEHLSFSASDFDPEQQLKLASVALFLEMVVIDDHPDETKEQALVLALVKKNFGVTDDQAALMIATAEQQRQQAADYFQFTSLINKQCSLEQKIRLIESLWKIAFVDGVIDPQEEYLVRKIANLLYVPHTNFILAKDRASSMLGH